VPHLENARAGKPPVAPDVLETISKRSSRREPGQATEPQQSAGELEQAQVVA
jgi:hypothetical protein